MGTIPSVDATFKPPYFCAIAELGNFSATSSRADGIGQLRAHRVDAAAIFELPRAS